MNKDSQGWKRLTQLRTTTLKKIRLACLRCAKFDAALLKNSTIGRSFTLMWLWRRSWGQLVSTPVMEIVGIEPGTPKFNVQLVSYRGQANSRLIFAPKRPYLTTPTKLNRPASNPPTKVLLLTIFDRDFWSARQVGVWSLAENIVPEKQSFHWMDMYPLTPIALFLRIIDNATYRINHYLVNGAV